MLLAQQVTRETIGSTDFDNFIAGKFDSGDFDCITGHKVSVEYSKDAFVSHEE